jgi:hypothetical protein
MALLSFQDLVTPVTEDQFMERFLSSLETVGLKARSWRPAGVYRTILRVLAGTCASFSDLQARFIRSNYLELAEGNWLTWTAFYVFGVIRPDATFASGQVSLTNAGGGVYDWVPGQLRIVNSTTKKAYTNKADVHLSALGTATFDIIAVEIGSASSSAAGAIDRVETFFGDISVTNAAPVIGSDAMPDADLRQLCVDKRSAKSVYGPRGAYRYAIRSALRADGSGVNINRVSVSPSSSTGRVTMIVASPSGVPAGDDVAACAANVEVIARNDTSTSVLSGATGHTITRALTIWARKQPGLSADDIRALAQTQLVALARDYPIGGIIKGGPGGYFWADSLDGAVQKAHPAIYSVDGLGADELMAIGEVAVFAVTIAAVRIVDAEVH